MRNVQPAVDSSGATIDLSLANGFTRQGFADFLAARGARIIGRNTFRQPSTKYVDFRVSKTFDFPHNTHAEIILEVFNLFNNRVESVGGNNLNLIRATLTQSTGAFTFSQNQPTVVGLTNQYASPDPRQAQIAAKFRF